MNSNSNILTGCFAIEFLISKQYPYRMLPYGMLRYHYQIPKFSKQSTKKNKFPLFGYLILEIV
jgi:hypothetical protein